MFRMINLILLLVLGLSVCPVRADENLDRGLVALARDRGQVFLSWRLLRSDPEDIAFNIYRLEVLTGKTEKVNAEPLAKSTCYLDDEADPGASYRYWVRPLVQGRELESSKPFFVRAFPFSIPYVQILLKGNYTAHNVAVADLDSDGAYDYIIKQPDFNTDPWREPGYWERSRDTYKIEAYTSQGKFLWRYDMGWAIEMGTWYAPYIVYDIDGDGRAELYAKAGEGDPREIDGEVVSGPEYLVKIDGLRGELSGKIPWFSREGFDAEMSHVTRNFLTVAYLDGKKPSLIMQRGTYRIIKTGAFDAGLEKLWYWEASGPDEKYQGQGQHGLMSADIDGDGRDELVIGSAALDDNGRALWTTGLGHPDVGYVADIDPDRPGLEIFYGLETAHQSGGVCLAEAKTGKIIWSYDGPTKHVHEQGMTGDIVPAHPGLECYAGESDGSQYWLYSAKGERLSDKSFGDLAPRAIWWDGDPQKEIECNGRIFKYGADTLAVVEGTVIGMADCLGDWREEIITSLPGEIRIYSTSIPTETRRVCLMQDRQYRLGVAAASMGYFYPPQLGGNTIP